MKRIATVLVVGFVCGQLAVVFAISNASLLARGVLSAQLSTMIVVALFSVGIMAVTTAFTSGIRGQITTTQAISMVALAAVSGAAATGFSGPPEGPAFLATVLAAMGLTTALTGLTMLLLGLAGLGRIIRFVPYPVFGGFLAITGWYLVVGGLEIVVGEPVGLSRIADPEVRLKLMLAVAFASFMLVFGRRMKSAVLLPVAVVAVIVAFNLVVAAAVVPLAELQRTGWVIPVPEDGAAWPPIAFADLGGVDWKAVLGAMVFAPAVVLVTVAAAIMNASGIELEIGTDIDLNRELRSMGLGNVLSGLFGGVPGFPSVSGTLMAARLGAAERVTGVLAGCTVLLGVVFAQDLMSVTPAPLLGALLMWLGAPLLIQWVLKPIRRLHKGEYAIILLILAVSILAGFPAGILTGLVMALGLFVVEYSRVATARFIADGRDYHGDLMPEALRDVLKRHGGAVVIAKLSGFVFFGTGDRIVQEIVQRVVANGERSPRFVVMDFRRVTGIDSSAVMSFVRLQRFAARRDIAIVLSGLAPAIRERLASGGLDLDGGATIRIEPSLDDALHWATERLMAALAPESVEPLASGAAGQAVAGILGDDGLARAMYPYLDRVLFEAGARVIEQGAISDDIYFIEEGEGVVQLEPADAAPVRLAAFGRGTILGEVAFYRGEPRSASIIARTPIVASSLSRAALDSLEAEAPELAARFHQQMARVLAGRLQSANRLIRVLAD
jgi:SulP family sulfate permease